MTRSTSLPSLRGLALIAASCSLLIVLVSCSNDDANSGETRSGGTSVTSEVGSEVGSDTDRGPTGEDSTVVRVLVHDSVAIDSDVLQSFEEEHAVSIELIPAGDAGAMVNQAVLTKGEPIADVIYGLDNTFLPVAIANDVLTPWTGTIDGVDSIEPDLTAGIADVPVIPVDFGDVCINADVEAMQAAGLDMPETLADLASPTYAPLLVIEDPRQSSPGLSFLLASFAELGEGSWETYWTDLANNGVLVAGSWETAYFDEFSGGGDGDRPLVVSYSTSPAADAVYAEEPVDHVGTINLDRTCVRQVEYAGILKGTDIPEEAGEVLSFFLSTPFQERIATDMFMYPARGDVALPAEFERFAPPPADPLPMPSVSPDQRDELLRTWADLMG